MLVAVVVAVAVAVCVGAGAAATVTVPAPPRASSEVRVPRRSPAIRDLAFFHLAVAATP